MFVLDKILTCKTYDFDDSLLVVQQVDTSFGCFDNNFKYPLEKSW